MKKARSTDNAMLPSVSVELGFDEESNKGYNIKISSPVYELNVFVLPDDVAKLHQVRATPWIDGALKIGKSAGAQAFWSSTEDNQNPIAIDVGHDDQTWDFGVSVPTTTLEEVLRELEACRREERKGGQLD